MSCHNQACFCEATSIEPFSFELPLGQARVCLHPKPFETNTPHESHLSGVPCPKPDASSMACNNTYTCKRTSVACKHTCTACTSTMHRKAYTHTHTHTCTDMHTHDQQAQTCIHVVCCTHRIHMSFIRSSDH